MVSEEKTEFGNSNSFPFNKHENICGKLVLRIPAADGSSSACLELSLTIQVFFMIVTRRLTTSL